MPAIQMADEDLIRIIVESIATNVDAEAPQTLAQIALEAGTASIERDVTGRTLTVGTDPSFFHGIPFDLDRLGEGVARAASAIAAPNTGSADQGVLVRITPKELETLDKLVNLAEVLAGNFREGFSDDAWNLRNRLVPYVPGEKHYDAEIHAD